MERSDPANSTIRLRGSCRDGAARHALGSAVTFPPVADVETRSPPSLQPREARLGHALLHASVRSIRFIHPSCTAFAPSAMRESIAVSVESASGPAWIPPEHTTPCFSELRRHVPVDDRARDIVPLCSRLPRHRRHRFRCSVRYELSNGSRNGAAIVSAWWSPRRRTAMEQSGACGPRADSAAQPSGRTRFFARGPL